MKINRTGERTRPIQAKELLEFGEPLDLVSEVNRIIEDFRPDLIRWARAHKGKFSYMDHGRQVIELLPDLQAEFAPQPEEWPAYKDQLGKIRSLSGSGDYIVGAIQWFPERRAEIQADFSDTISRIGLGVRSPVMDRFYAAHQLTIIAPDVKHQVALKENLEPVLHEIFGRSKPIYSFVVDAAKVVIHFPERKAEIQAFCVTHFPEIRAWVANVRQDKSPHDLAGFLHSLKTIFAEQVISDEFGRLTFETGKAMRGGKSLPARLEA